MDILNKIVACSRCKWIGFEKDMGKEPFTEETGVINPVIREVDVLCCPKCRRIPGILSPKYLGIRGFISAYFEKEII